MATKSRLTRYLDSANPKNILTIWGSMVYSVSNCSGVAKRKFDWANALIDASITSAITFFGALGGGAVAGITDLLIVESAAVAALSQFFVFLALKRGLVREKELLP
jgi:hypothetical protein